MDKLTQLWAWLNGKKTTIGMGFFLVGLFLKDIIQGFYGVEADWIDPTIKTMNYVAALFGVGGLTHKMAKHDNTKQNADV